MSEDSTPVVGRRRRGARIGGISAAGVALALAASAVIASPAFANTRGDANSYINTRVNINTTPGAPGFFWANNGLHVWMNCWEGGPQAMGQGKWFNITVNEGTGFGVTGYVPAPAVSNQWTSSPHC